MSEHPTQFPAAPPLAGPLMFIRYGFMPNRLQYCGGPENETLLGYALEGTVDPGLPPLLRKFTGALPYLQLIARCNGLADPFDRRVVEAYWIGNELLDGVEARSLYDDLRERFRRQLSPKLMELVAGKAPAGAHPHHSFHVLDVYRREGERGDSLVTMDACRASWGRVMEVRGPELRVERRPLEVRDGRLVLGAEQSVTALRQVDGRGFADDAQAGDWVSLHWGWVCEVLDRRQLHNLERYTERHLQIANQTL
jgi:hydrogenase maturation factor